MNTLQAFCSQLKASARYARCRYLVVIQGSLSWSRSTAQLFIEDDTKTLQCGPPLLAEINTIAFRQAKQWLGRECESLIVNARDGFDAEVFGAMTGTLVGGGLCVLVLPEQGLQTRTSMFDRRLAGLLQSPDVYWLREGQVSYPLAVSHSEREPDTSNGRAQRSRCDQPFSEKLAKIDADADADADALTVCQAQAITAIRRVVTGHRKRPLVLTADRGRGKSAALGLAAASLLAERSLRIGITAPSYAAAETVFRHGAMRLGLPFSQQRKLQHGSGSLVFFSPDALLAEQPKFDVLFVDEAAAIPAPILHTLLQRYNRLVFASTVHGYEGTGRGFAVKFRALLDQVMPQWREFKMAQPIRWAEQDPLERWVFNALLLDADIDDVALAAVAIGEQQGDSADSPSCIEISYRAIDKQTLASDEKLLRQVFGLLVNAHYQTSPSDLTALLDDPQLHVLVGHANEQVVSCCLVQIEGGFDDELVMQIQNGSRRPKGHLLVQSLAAHLGIGQAASQLAGRILRIAVHPDLQQQGLGLAMLQFTERWAVGQVDYLGTSFGFAPELLRFWQKAGYVPVRLGFKNDAASGYPSLLCVQALEPVSQHWQLTASTIFAATFASNAMEAYSQLALEQFVPLYLMLLPSMVPVQSLPADIVDHHLALYSAGGLGYELALPALTIWLNQTLLTATQEQAETLAYAIAKVIQRQSWSDMVVTFNLAGRKQAEQVLRDLVYAHLNTSDIKESE